MCKFCTYCLWTFQNPYSSNRLCGWTELLSIWPNAIMVKSSKRLIKWACGACERNCHACVYCSGCKIWFHAECENLTAENFEVISNLRDDYLCSSCTKATGFSGSIKRLKGSRASLSSKIQMEDIYLKRMQLQLHPIRDPRTRPVDRISSNLLKLSGMWYYLCFQD